MVSPSRRAAWREGFAHQVRDVGPGATVAFVAVGVVYALAWGLAKARDIEPIVLTEDPASILDGPFYTGTFQYATFVGWWTAALLSGVTASLLHKRGQRRLAGPLFAFCIISTWLAVDDMFQVHEVLLDEHAGIPQYVTFTAYGLIAFFVFWHARWFIATTDWLLLALFAVLFGAGQLLDQAGDELGHHYATPEKGFELLGVTAWVLYVARSSLRYLTVREDSARIRGAGMP